jgi:hypothetical protein
MSVLEQLRS